MKKNVTVAGVMRSVYSTIGCVKRRNKTQDPDEIKLYKQWNEFGIFKGYWVGVIYKGKNEHHEDLEISFDATYSYTRVLGNLEKIPPHTPGKHNFPATKRIKK